MRETYQLFDIPIFTYEHWADIDGDMLNYFDVEFLFDSMKQFNGSDLTINANGYVDIYKTMKNKFEWKGYLIHIAEYKDLLKHKLEEI